MKRRLVSIRWGIVLIGLALAGASGCGGCNENKAATQACKGAANRTACTACCGMHGSNITSNWGHCKCY